jgi:hypothetical protein
MNISPNTLIVLGTHHSEGGACTSDELNKIIKEINPDVIFCEASPKKLPLYIRRTDVITPEMEVIKELVKEKSIEIVPIDVEEDPFDKRLEAMFSLFSRKMKVYHNASNILSNETYLKGFVFLNSKDCDKIFRDKNDMERFFIDKAKNQQLSEFYFEWLKWNDAREYQWINLIGKYFKNNKPNKAIFLVGAGHRYRLIDKIELTKNESSQIVKWDFFHFN